MVKFFQVHAKFRTKFQNEVLVQLFVEILEIPYNAVENKSKKASVCAENQLNPLNHFDRTETFDRHRDRRTQGHIYTALA